MSRAFTRARRRPPKLEYACYFAVIFLCSLPVALVKSALGFGRGEARAGGFVSRAWSEARTVTPLIFSA